MVLAKRNDYHKCTGNTMKWEVWTVNGWIGAEGASHKIGGSGDLLVELRGMNRHDFMNDLTLGAPG